MSTATSGSITLLKAQEAALSRDERIDTLSLDPIRKGVPSLPIEASIIGAKATLTIDGASTLTLSIHDPKWLIEQSELLRVGIDGRLTAIRVTVDALAFRLVKASRVDPTTLELTFEDEVVALLREHNKPLASSRNSLTRAQFIESLIREVKARQIPFFAPEKGRKQPAALPDFPNARPDRTSSGFDDGTKLKIKGVLADAQQMRELATILTVADQEEAKGRARIAQIVAAIGESSVRAIANAQGSGPEGVFQADPEKIPRRDTGTQARYFLTGGRGFQAGGAIKAARDHPDWTPGTIAFHVEGDRSNFSSDAEAADFYDKWRKEADAIIAAWNPGTGSQDSPVLRVRSYQFTRGQGGKKETSWDAATRLAQEVQWRLFAMGGIVWFVSDDYLISKPAGLVLDGFKAPGLLAPPLYDWDEGKTTQTVELRASANRWGIHPGEVVALQAMGPVTGRWIVQTVELDLLNATDTAVTMIKPLAPKKEPSAETISVSTSSTPGGSANGAGVDRAIAWARSKVGHYKEEFGSNRGTELDALEKGFGMRGEPWCAIFATTAITHGGVPDSAKTAAVAQIRAWAEKGTHGYTRGFRATPKPGDLMCFGTEHVALVEKVHGDTVDTIEGNTSAGQVARRSRLKSTGQFVRPDYAT